ncbi:MAG TPA: hypothetical protein VNT53_03410 [Pseudolysinimonas sp.]|nr:hypothetical protein [Pseudolysinimonas sp.]
MERSRAAERADYKLPPEITLHVLHFLWTLPLTWVIGNVLWTYQGILWCGYGGCLDGYSFWDRTDSTSGVAISVTGGLLVVAAFVVPPWLWPWWARLIIALPFAAFHIYYFGWGNSPAPTFIPTLRNGFF